ncbi:MAG: kelch repeat-containing protein [Polyangiaceae bacterium]
MTRWIPWKLVFLCCAFLLASLAGLRSSAAQSGLPYWSEIQQNGDVPAPAWDGSSAYHDGWFFVFGGLDGTYPNDEPVDNLAVFDVETATWYGLSGYPGGPSARAEAMMWYVPEDGSLMVAGGRGPFRRGLDLTHRDTFRLDPLQGWSEVHQDANRAELANRSTEAVVVPKQGNDKTIAYAFSGSSSTLPAFINRPDGLQHNLVRFKNGWKEVETTGAAPRGRAHYPLTYSEGLHAFFLYGGYTNDAVNGTGVFSPANYLGDLWTFDLDAGAWAQLAFDEAAGPGHRDNAKLLVDEDSGRIWLFGGGQFDGTTLADLWYFDLDTSTWTRDGDRDDGYARAQVRPVLLRPPDRRGLRIRLRRRDEQFSPCC